jgi:hypothetical protein
MAACMASSAERLQTRTSPSNESTVSPLAHVSEARHQSIAALGQRRDDQAQVLRLRLLLASAAVAMGAGGLQLARGREPEGVGQGRRRVRG